MKKLLIGLLLIVGSVSLLGCINDNNEDPKLFKDVVSSMDGGIESSITVSRSKNHKLEDLEKNEATIKHSLWGNITFHLLNNNVTVNFLEFTISSNANLILSYQGLVVEANKGPNYQFFGDKNDNKFLISAGETKNIRIEFNFEFSEVWDEKVIIQFGYYANENDPKQITDTYEYFKNEINNANNKEYGISFYNFKYGWDA